MVAALLLGANSSLYAGDNARSVSDVSEAFIGLELGGTFVQGDTGGPLGELNHDGTGASVGLRLGAQNAAWRSMLVLDYFDSDDDDQTYERAMIQVDYYLMSSTYNTTAFRPYIGLNGGYVNYESTAVDESGFSYGGQVGFTAAVSENIDFDIAYRYSVASPDELDHIGNVVFGLNYLY